MTFPHNPKYNHQEAFRLMLYKCKACGNLDRVWNSRDGVTPFGIGCSGCKCRGIADHVFGYAEPQTEELPVPATRVFVSITKEDAEAIAKDRIEHFSKQGYVSDDPDAEENLAKHIYGDGNQPMTISVAAYHERQGQ